MIQNLIFLLEEPSAQEMLRGIVPRIIPPGIEVYYIHFQGKQDLEKNIERKIRLWQRPNSAFVIMRDQDSAVCTEVKQRLADMCAHTGKTKILIRIACHELESFYLGDLKAVGYAYKIQVPSQDNKKYRTPDSLANAAEELQKITRKQYQKIDGSRRIAQFLSVNGENCSHSYNVLCTGIRKLVGDERNSDS